MLSGFRVLESGYGFFCVNRGGCWGVRCFWGFLCPVLVYRGRGCFFGFLQGSPLVVVFDDGLFVSVCVLSSVPFEAVCGCHDPVRGLVFPPGWVLVFGCLFWAGLDCLFCACFVLCSVTPSEPCTCCLRVVLDVLFSIGSGGRPG